MTVAAPAGGITVAYSSSSPAAIIPPLLVMPEGATSQAFDVTTVNAPPTTTGQGSQPRTPPASNPQRSRSLPIL